MLGGSTIKKDEGETISNDRELEQLTEIVDKSQEKNQEITEKTDLQTNYLEHFSNINVDTTNRIQNNTYKHLNKSKARKKKKHCTDQNNTRNKRRRSNKQNQTKETVYN